MLRSPLRQALTFAAPQRSRPLRPVTPHNQHSTPRILPLTSVDRSFHHTNYVVDHGHYLQPLIFITGLLLLAWHAISRLRQPIPETFAR